MPDSHDTLPVQVINSLDDPRIAGYRNLRERDLRAEGLFITEGALLAERLLQSHFSVESLFVTVENAARFADLVQGRTPLYVAEAALMRQIVGFDFHRGILGLGRRVPFQSATRFVGAIAEISEQLRFIVCPYTETAENLGLILRSAAAFDLDGVLLPEQGADPLSRRCLRQSMGSALTLPIARSDDLLGDLKALRHSINLHLVAAVASDESAVVPLGKFVWPSRAALIVGNEFHGLEAAWLEVCDHLVTIPLAPNCDSLNVAVATGVLLYHMRSNGIVE